MSKGPLAFLNGRMIPAAELMIPAYDAGFVLGATMSEQLRTFGGKLYKLDEHLARMHRGLEITSIDAGCSTEQLATWAVELAAANHALLDPADDLGLSIFITPGPYTTFAPPDVPRRATIGMSTYPLPFHLWAEKYETGEHLVTSSVRQVSADSWPRELKCRSRMHYYLAEKEVRRLSPNARPLLLDERGFINETPTANIIGYSKRRETPDGEFLIPRGDAILPGISQSSLQRLTTPPPPTHNGNGGAGYFLPELVARVGDWTVEEFVEAVDEVLITSTPFCVLPVVKVDDRPIMDGRPGPMFEKLLTTWSKDVGVDIVAQAQRFSSRT